MIIAEGRCAQPTLYLFINKLRHLRNQQANSRSPGFLKLVASSKSNGSGIVIHLHSGVSIQVEQDFDPHTLRSVIEAIGWK